MGNEVINNIEERIKNGQIANEEELLSLLNTLKNDPRFKDTITTQVEENLLTSYAKNNKGNDIPKEIIISGVKKNIADKKYQNKEELQEELNKIGPALSEDDRRELLEYYDSMNKSVEATMDTENYKGTDLSMQSGTSTIAATQQDVVLKSNTYSSEMEDEFRRAQNIVSAESDNGLANADESFAYLQEHEKEELNLMTLSEAVEKTKDIEMLRKIQFFMNDERIKANNAEAYRVDPDNGIFYLPEKSEIYEVTKAENGQYVIMSDKKRVQGSSEEAPAEEATQEKTNPKVRRLTPPSQNPLINAFVSSGLLFIICIALSLMIALALFIR